MKRSEKLLLAVQYGADTGDGPLDRQGHRRHARGDHRRVHGADRHGADLSGRAHGQGARGAHDQRLPRGDRASGAAGRRLHDAARGDPARAPAARLRPRDRDREPRRLAARRVDDAPPQAESAVRALRRRPRHPAPVRRHHLARRLAAPGLDPRRERQGAVRRARHAGRAHEARVGVRRPGDGRRAGTHPDASDRDERPQAEGGLSRGALLHARAARDGHRARATITSRARSARR